MAAVQETIDQVRLIDVDQYKYGFETIIESIRTRLFQELPSETVVNTGHGPSTSIGAESPHLQEWIDRGE